MSHVDVVINNIPNNMDIIGELDLDTLIDELKKYKLKTHQPIASFQSKREQKTTDLINEYKGRKLVLVLGSGVSSKCGLPDWSTLLRRLLKKSMHFGEKSAKETSMDISTIFDQLFPLNPLIMARYIRTYCENRINYETNLCPVHKKTIAEKQKSFEETVRDAIYEELTPDSYSDLIKEIGNLCLAIGTSPNLDSIITYNYDDILETYLSGIGIEFPHKVIYSSGEHPTGRELPIYHVHGFLPRNGDLTEDNKIMLSDDAYHQQYSNIYGWNNMVQINKFINNTCLFIGTSLTDPNLRRLLDIAMLHREPKKYHYIIHARYNLDEIKEQLSDVLKKNNMTDESAISESKINEIARYLIKIKEDFEENDALSFGVITIWTNDYDDVPRLLRDIRSN